VDLGTSAFPCACSRELTAPCGARDIGTSTYTIAAQAAAEELGLGVEQVTVMLGDTDYPRVGNSTGATASAAVSNGVQLAAQSLRQWLVQLALSDPRSPLHNVSQDDVTVANGQLFGPARRTADTYGAALMRHQITTLDSFIQWDPASGLGLSGGRRLQVARANTSSWSFGAWFVIVTVDPESDSSALTELST